MDTPERDVFDTIYQRFPAAKVPWHFDQPPPELTSLLDSGEIPPGKAVELGCGLGSQCLALARHGLEVTGIDCSQTAIDHARGLATQSGVHAKE